MSTGLPELADGVWATVRLTLCAGMVSMAVGILVVFVRLNGNRIAGALAKLYVSFMRGTPALVQLFLVFFGMPAIGLGGHPFWAAAVAIGLNSAAYVSEILRGAILSVPDGQREAAEAIGMPPARYWRRVLLPQALTASIPALTNEATLLLKTTPLASVVAVTELTFSGQMIIARTYEAGRVLALVSVGYLILSFAITRGSAALERRLAVGTT
jgi:polar amino acid transport system permease protein